MTSFGIALVLSIIAYVSASAPWDIVLPIIIFVIWIASKVAGLGNRNSDSDDWGDFGDSGGGD